MRKQFTAEDAANTIVETLGVDVRPTTVDGLLAGDPSTPVTGIVTTMMATMDVLERAVNCGGNLIVTHEPAFWDHRNMAIGSLVAENDQVYARKLDYINEHGLVVWRLHDAMHDMRPDPVDVGTCKQLGWPVPDDYPAIVSIEPARLADVVAYASKKLGASAARYIGNPDLRVSGVGLALGFRGSDNVRHLLQDSRVEAVLIGEAHEWEVGAYAADAVSLGLRKALIVLGHIPSEQYGMAEVTTIIRDLFPEVPVSFVPCRDPYSTL